MMRKTQYWCLLTLLPILSAATVCDAQNRDGRNQARQPQRAPDKLETRVYRVRDFVLPTPNYTFRGIDLPSTDRSTGQGPAVGGGQAGGFFRVNDQVLMQQGGGGGMGGGTMGGSGFGGGFPARSSSGNHEFRITMDDLIETIVATIAPETWEDVGGPASIAELGGLLVIQQKKEVHESITNLLDSLAQQGAAPKSMTIYAYWLELDGGQIEQIKKRSNLQTLTTELESSIVARGQIACFDGQSVHIVGGDLRSGIVSWTPVVGQVEQPTEMKFAKNESPHPADTRESTVNSEERVTYLAQFEGQSLGNFNSVLSEGRAVGYRPETKAINVGTMLQVTPVLSNAGNSVALDVHNIVVSPPASSAQPTKIDGQQIDRVNVNAQQFRTTLQIPINQVRIVGGFTLHPTVRRSDKQLYLLMEVSPEK